MQPLPAKLLAVVNFILFLIQPSTAAAIEINDAYGLTDVADAPVIYNNSAAPHVSVAPWPATPYQINLPGRNDVALVFTGLGIEGTAGLQSQVIAALQVLHKRLFDPKTPAPFNFHLVLPETADANTLSASLSVSFHAQVSRNSAITLCSEILSTLGTQIVAHGLRDLAAVLVAQGHTVAEVRLELALPITAIPTNLRLTVLLAIPVQAPILIQISGFGRASGVPLEQVLDTVEEAYEKVTELDQQARFTNVDAINHGEGAKIHFGMGAGTTRPSAVLFSNMLATAAVKAMQSFLADLGPRSLEFRVISYWLPSTGIPRTVLGVGFLNLRLGVNGTVEIGAKGMTRGELASA